MIVFDKAIFTAILHKDFPHLTQAQVKWFDNGWDHIIAVVDRSLAYRFPRREDYAKKLPIETQFTEMVIDKLPLPIPQLKLKKDSEHNFIYAKYPFIEGTPLLRELFRTLHQNEQNVLAEKLGEFLTALHSYPINKAEDVGIQKVDSVEVWKRRLERIRNIVYPIIPKKEQEWIDLLFQKYLTITQEVPFKQVVIHGDIAPEHILFDTNTKIITGIIDFGDVEISDPAFDFFHLSYFYGEDFLKQVYKHYKLPQDVGFDERRKFYHNRWPVTNLEHSILTRNEDSILLHKKQLSEYIKQNLL